MADIFSPSAAATGKQQYTSSGTSGLYENAYMTKIITHKYHKVYYDYHDDHGDKPVVPYTVSGDSKICTVDHTRDEYVQFYSSGDPPWTDSTLTYTTASGRNVEKILTRAEWDHISWSDNYEEYVPTTISVPAVSYSWK